MNPTIDLPGEVYECRQKEAQLIGTTFPEPIAQLIEEIETTHHLWAVAKQMQAEGLFAELPDSLTAMPSDFQPIR